MAIITHLTSLKSISCRLDSKMLPKFQCLIDFLFPFFPIYFHYLENIFILSKNGADHLLHLKQVLLCWRQKKNGLSINTAVPEVDCLGHHVTSIRLQPLSSKVQPFCPFQPLQTFPLCSISWACSLFTAISSPA